MKNILITGILSLLFTVSLNAQENIDHLKAFAKAYGYVKYFHPSTETTKINWDKFSAYGTSKILECKSNEDLVETLNALFKPMAPSIIFSAEIKEFDFKKITPKNMDGFVQTYWQHNGVSTGMEYDMYESALVNQSKIIDDTITVITEPIFDAKPEFGELIEKKIMSQLYCQIPLTLYSNEKNTYPVSENIDDFQSLVDSFEVDLKSASVRIGNIINVYNTMQHFYPYFDVVNVDWDKEFEIALHRSFIDQNAKDHVISLQKFMAKLRDSHTWVWQGPSPYQYYPPITWEWVQDSLIITKLENDSLNVKVGDIVTHINGQSSKEYFKEVNSRISHGTKTYLNHSIKTRSLSAEENTELSIRIKNQDISLFHTSQYSVNDYPKIQENVYKLIGDDLMYVNLASISADTLSKILPELQKMKGLVCDYRGRNLEIWQFPHHFSKDSIPNGYIIKNPKIIYPDQEQIRFGHSQGIEGPKEPYLGDIKTVFIIDGSVKSAGESFISTVKHNNLAIIVGEQTAGAEGYINPFKVLGDITIYWTGTKAIHADGSQFHAIGIQPDIYVEKTIKGIREGKDEFLEKAIEIMTKK